MRLLIGLPVTLALTTAALMSVGPPTPAAAPGDVGTIRGRVRLDGRSPGNTVIRMGVDPMCAAINDRKRVLQEVVVTSADGGLAHVFVNVQGSFPDAPAPTGPVTIDQRGCIYTPRVVGARVGQTLQVRNSDRLLHNVRGRSTGSNEFNIGQPLAGMVDEFRLTSEEIMLRLSCDVHRWMTAYIGVVAHPYFAVTDGSGAFEIADVPVGTHTIQTWHERYGVATQQVRIRKGETTTVNFPYEP